MTADQSISGPKQLTLYSLEQELTRALEAYNAIQTRLNTVISLCVTITVAFVGILGAILKFAETSSAWQTVAEYLPWAALFSMLVAWRIAAGLRRELISVLSEADLVERDRDNIVTLNVKPFQRRLREEVSYLGIRRETYVLLTIATGWAGYLVQTHNIIELLKKLFG